MCIGKGVCLFMWRIGQDVGSVVDKENRETKVLACSAQLLGLGVTNPLAVSMREIRIKLLCGERDSFTTVPRVVLKYLRNI